MADTKLTVSDEQHKYITYDKLENTKLLATAGSGKTFCIIQHIKFLVQNGVVEPEHIFMLTFSKNAKDDFQRKVKKHSASECIPNKNICTIDSFAWRMLGPDISKDIDVSLLSFAWLDELKTHTQEELLEKYPLLNNIRMIFVDEAQDLNEVQYNIMMRMQQVAPQLSVHMIGDPNQNIYQFRKASDKFLIHFPAQTFYLTTNYRSQAHIVDFCSHLRPYNDVPISSNQPKQSLDVTFYAYENHNMFEHMMLSILHLFQAKKIPLHKCAILAPTRGYIRDSFGACRYKGLCYIANLLYHHKIPFSQFYNDVGSKAEQELSNKVNYKPKSGCINLMTYTSSKGLEWDYVIIVDANAHLISRIDYDNDKYNAERYLLYVACSRPRKNLIVFTKRKYANPWFKDVPKDKYKIARYCEESFDFFDTSLLFDITPPSKREEQTPTLSLKTVINKMELEKLYCIQKLLIGKVKRTSVIHHELTRRLKFPDIRATFTNQFLSHLLYVGSIGRALQHDHVFVRDVHNIIHKENVLLCPNERVISWYYDNRNDMTWSTWEAVKSSLDAKVVRFIENYFDKEKEFNSYTLIDRFYDIYVQRHLKDIKEAYDAYVHKRTISNVLCMTRMAYAIRSTHYFYIEQKDLFQQEFLDIANESYFDVFLKFAESVPIHALQTQVCINEKSVALPRIDVSNKNIPIYINLHDGLNIKDILLCLMYAKAFHEMNQSSVHEEPPYTPVFVVHMASCTMTKLTFDDIERQDFEKIVSLLK